MLTRLTSRTVRFLRWTERFTKTDMVYLAKGGFWMNLSSLTITLLSFVLYVAFARFLPKDVYGTYQYFLSISAIIIAFTLGGMNTAVAQAVTRGFEGTYRAAIRIQFLWSLIPLAGAFIGAGYYAFQGNYELATGLVLIGLAIPFVTTFNTYGAYFLGKKDFRRVFLYNLVLNIPYYAGLILAAFYFKSALVLLAVNLGINAIVLFVLHRRVLSAFTLNDKVDPEALSYGKHLSVMGTLAAIINQLDNVLVFHFLGPVDLAIYTFATAIPDRAASFFRFFSFTSLPKFAEKTESEIRSTLGPKLLKLSVVALLSALGYIVVAPLLFHIFFPQYLDSIPFSALYALSMLGLAGGVAVSALTAQQRTKDLYIFSIVTPLLQLALQYGGIILYGLWGLVAGKTVSVLLTSVISVTLLFQKPKEKAA